MPDGGKKTPTERRKIRKKMSWFVHSPICAQEMHWFSNSAAGYLTSIIGKKQTKEDKRKRLTMMKRNNR